MKGLQQFEICRFLGVSGETNFTQCKQYWSRKLTENWNIIPNNCHILRFTRIEPHVYSCKLRLRSCVEVKMSPIWVVKLQPAFEFSPIKRQQLNTHVIQMCKSSFTIVKLQVNEPVIERGRETSAPAVFFLFFTILKGRKRVSRSFFPSFFCCFCAARVESISNKCFDRCFMCTANGKWSACRRLR